MNKTKTAAVLHFNIDSYLILKGILYRVNRFNLVHITKEDNSVILGISKEKT